MNTLGVVHIEHGFSPQPPAAFRRLAGKPQIEWVVRRVSESGQLDSLVVALSGTSDDDHGISKLIPANVPILSITTCRGGALQFAEIACDLGADSRLRQQMAALNLKSQHSQLPMIDHELHSSTS